MTPGLRLPLLALLALAAAPAGAEAPRLSLPIDCTLGRDCYIEDYVDKRAGPGQRDYTCGIKSRDGHDGTDFGLIRHDQMARGVNVLASAPGRVRALRDGMEDRPYAPADAAEIEGRECGNAVAITHGDGYETLYCHMKKGSLRVEPGAQVARGEVLGQVGMSGQSNFPHVHLGVLRNGDRIDPFAPENGRDTCGTPGPDLWEVTPDYHRAGLFTLGFATEVPGYDAVKSGAARIREAGRDAPALVVYADMFHAEDGDGLRLEISGPGGQLIDETIALDDPQVRLFRAVGRKRPEEGWPAGRYRGRAVLSRSDRILASRHADIVIPE